MNLKNKLTGMACIPFALAMLSACTSDDETDNQSKTNWGGQKLTINATNGAEATRTTFIDGDKKVSAAWATDDNVVIVTGASGSITNTETFTATPDATNPHNATLTGTLTTAIENGATVSGFITSSYITSNSLGSSKKQVFVDYSAQKGTFDDAMAHCLQFGSAIYTGGENIPEMHFDYKTSFFCLTLDFGDTNVAGTAQMTLTGDGLVSKSAVNTIYNGGGSFYPTNETLGDINISDVNVENGKANVWIALKPAEMKNVTLTAKFDNGDGYKFNVSGDNAATLAAGKVYAFSRTGEEMPVEIQGDGSEDTPYQISNLKQLSYVAEMVNKGDAKFSGKKIELTADIALNGTWTPIGTSSKPFKGIFDGKGHKFTGSYSITELTDCCGLFGCIDDATVTDVHNEAEVNVSVKDATKAGQYVGAIVGKAKGKSTIEYCSNKGNITADAGFVGGVIGQVITDDADISVVACWNEGNLSNKSQSTSSKGLGGVVGNVNVANATNKVVIYGCYNRPVDFVFTGTSSAYLGGIVGYAVNANAAEQLEIYACWASASSFDFTAKKYAIVSAAGSAKKYNVHDVWYSSNVGFTQAVNAIADTELNALKGASVKPYTNGITTMNSALTEANYKYNNNGDIQKK